MRQGIPFQIRHPVGELGSQVLLPTKYLEEVKKAPTDLFSFEAYSAKSFLLDYSRAPRQTEAAAHAIRVDLNRNLGKLSKTSILSSLRFMLIGSPGPLVTDLWNEAAQHLSENVSFEWKTVSAYELVCSFVARVASVALVGAPLCRNPAWQQIVVETTFVAFGAAQAIKDKYTPRWRWLAPWSESIQKDLRRIRKQSIELLRPLYEERREAMSNTDSFRDPSEVYRDVVFWLMKSSQKDRSLYGINESQLFLSLTAIHTTSGTLNSFVYDWIAHPEYHDDILLEVTETLAKVQANNEQWTLQHVAMMRKLDSFMKESARLNPIGFGESCSLKRRTNVKGQTVC